MASLTIRNLDDEIKQGLRYRAATNGVSMEQEARAILRDAIRSPEKARQREEPEENWYQSLRQLVEPYGGFELDIPPRSKSMREPPSFD
ncbi:MAG: plasmid stabilization protein [Mesorhizobium sp.]|nr:plasmid stabilization protein [Mesorhizobium sp.]MBN9242999.1 plasmid stabilization protein [Mesorhizobium sp.]